MVTVKTVGAVHAAVSTSADPDRLVIGLALIGKAAVVSCFCTMFIYSSEIFPTVVRTIGMGSCAFFSRIGSLLAPQLLLASRHLHADNPQLVTFLTFGGCSILAGLLTFLLPETQSKNLPDTVRESNELSSVDEDGRDPHEVGTFGHSRSGH